MEMLDKKNPIQKFNSVQLNIVTFVDVKKAVTQQSLERAVYMMDNSIDSSGQGTSELRTTCKQGQTLNWIIYAMDAEKRPDGNWPPTVKINNIVFLGDNGEDVAVVRICDDLKVYGPPDKIRSKYTPVYYYWAGTIPMDLPVGIYRYRLVMELEDEVNDKMVYLNLNTVSLKVVEIV